MKSLKEYIIESIFDIDDKVENFDSDIYKAKVEKFCKKHRVREYEILPDGKVDILQNFSLIIDTDADVKDMVNLNVVKGNFTLTLNKGIDFDLLPEYVGSLYLMGSVPVSNHTFVILDDAYQVNIAANKGDYSGLKIHYRDVPRVYPIIWGDATDIFKGIELVKAGKIVIESGAKPSRKRESDIIKLANKRIKYLDIDSIIYGHHDKRLYVKYGDKFILEK